MTNDIQTILRRFIPFATAITLMSGMAFGVGQQVMRQDGYDPQVQISEDSADYFAASVKDLPPSADVDVTSSLLPFLVVYDKDGKPLSASGKLDGEIPIPPLGVFAFTKQNKQDRITWEPKSGVRFATVITSTGGDDPKFVLVARSLREVEMRTQRLLRMVAFGWVVSLVIVFAALVVTKKKQPAGAPIASAGAGPSLT